MTTTAATATIPTSYYFIYNGETMPGFIEGDYAYAERRREALARFCGVKYWEIEIKKR
jgi:hypothetical protein